MFQGHPGVTTGAMTPPTIDSPPCSSGGEGSSLSGGGIIYYALVGKKYITKIYAYHPSQSPSIANNLILNLNPTASSSGGSGSGQLSKRIPGKLAMCKFCGFTRWEAIYCIER